MKRIDKRILYMKHAGQRLTERGVSTDQVARTLRNPDVVRPAKSPRAKRFEKALSKRTRLVVIAEEKPTEFLVISAWEKR
jgi:hypothetical protein